MSTTPHDRTTAAREPGGDDAARPRGTRGPAGEPLGSPAPGEQRAGAGRAAPSPVAEERASAPRTTAADDVEPRPSEPPRTSESAHATGQQAPVDPALDKPAKRGVSGTVWAALILGVVVLILLLVFIIQNNVSTRFEYMAWEFSLPLGVAMLFSAIAGALIMALVGSVRIFTLGHRLRKLEKERQRIRTAVSD
ncbi:MULTISPECIES: LapA family protein [Kocuria]|uniref:Lipopolysaccharide assembly protein LapA domain-containing protein n=1 Tax=Kocuria salsicia TaxID=664639 RepID=A0ABV3KCP6_9MICC|nr:MULTISPECIES: LapA family protein [Kocuria]